MTNYYFDDILRKIYFTDSYALALLQVKVLQNLLYNKNGITYIAECASTDDLNICMSHILQLQIT